MIDTLHDSNLKLGVFISGRGSNMEAILKACLQDNFPAEVLFVVSNNPDAGGLAIAESYGVETHVINHKDFETKKNFESALHELTQKYAPDLICLAGFMRVLSSNFIRNYPDRIVNMHPSLLPKYKGLNPHQQVLDNNEKQTGCTVHIVIPDVDAGPIILQREVDVEPDDTEDILSQRVLEIEHQLYPEAIRKIALENLKKIKTG